MTKYSNTNKSLRKIVLASLLALPMATSLWATLPSTAAGNLTAPAGVTTSLTTGITVDTLAITVAGSTKTNTILTWGDFGGAGGAIGNGAKTELIQFNQPTADSSVLNKVTTGTTTLGAKASISSNGNVLIYNPNGILIDSGATINVAGFTASTINDADVDSKFAADGTLSFSGATAGSLDVNNATITTINGSGSVVLAGTGLTIDGTVTGNLTVRTLTTGAAITLSNDTSLTVQKDAVTGNGGALTVLSFGGNVDVAGAGNLTTVLGNATLDTRGTAGLMNGSISDTGLGIRVDTGKTLDIIAGGNLFAAGNVVLNGASNNVGTLKLSSANNATFVDADDVTISTSSLTGSLNVTSTAGSINSSGAVTMAAGQTVTLSANTAAKSITFQGSGALTIAGALSPTVTITTDGNLTATAANLANGTAGQLLTSLTLKSTAGALVASTPINASNAGSVTLEGYTGVTTGTLSAKTISVTSANGTATLGNISGLSAANSAATINVKGDIALPQVRVIDTLTVTSNNGAITQTGVIDGNLIGGSVNASFTALNEITLLNASNNFNYLKLVNTTATKAVQIRDANGGLNLNNGTSVVGDLSLQASDGDLDPSNDHIIFGVAAGDTITTAKTTLTTPSTVYAVAKNVTTGELNLAVTGNVTFDVASSNFVFGTVKGSANDLTIKEQSGLDFGTLTVGGNLVATSTVGITDSAAFTVTGTSNLDLATNTGNITLDAGNTFTGAVTFGTSTKAVDVYLKSASNLIIASGKATGTLGLETTGATTITQTGAIDAAGVTTLKNAATGGVVTLNNAGNKFSSVTLAVAGTSAVTLRDSDSTLTINGTTAGALTVTSAGSTTFNATATNVAVGITASAGDITVNGNVTGAGAALLSATASAGKVLIGNFFSESGGLTAYGHTGIEDVDGARANVFSNVSFTTNGAAVAITNYTDINTAGTVAHQFGGITVDTTNGGAVAAGGAVSINEGGTLRIVSINAGTKDISLMATGTGSNVWDSAAAAATLLTTTGNVTLQANNNVRLADAGGQTITVGGNLYSFANTSVGTTDLGVGAVDVDVTGQIAIVTGGNATLINGLATKLGATAGVGTGDFYVGGAFNLTSAGAVTQTSGILHRIKGATTISAAGQNVTLTNTNNEFGAMGITANNVSLYENGTLNLGASTIGGTLTAQSTLDIIDSGAVVVTGATTLTTNTGKVELDVALNNFGDVKVITSGDAKIIETGGVRLLGGTYVGGAGYFQSTGTINDFGVLKVVGTLYLESSAGGSAISLTNPANEFGTITFKATGAGTTTIVESATMKLGVGLKSNAGLVTLQSINGEILTDSTLSGGSNFGAGGVTLYSNDNVTVTHPWTIAGTFTINTPAAKIVDLSGISLLANLGGVSPTVVGGTLKSGTPTP